MALEFVTTRRRLAARMAVTLAAVTPINLAFGVSILLVVAPPLVVLFPAAPEALASVVRAVVGPVSLFGLGTVPTAAVASGLVFAGVLGFVVPVVHGPEVLIEDTDATVVDAADEPRFVETLGRVSQSAGVPTPEAAVAESRARRSFAAGRKGDGTVVVTRALLEALDDDELAAVLAHEVSHLVNRDATVICYPAFYPLLFAAAEGPFGTDVADDFLFQWIDRLLRTVGWIVYGFLAAAMVLFLGLVAGDVLRGVAPLSELVRGIVAVAVGLVVVWLLLLSVGRIVGWVFGLALYAVVLPFLALAQYFGWALAASLSRAREYAADRGAVAITGDPAALASALRTLDDGRGDAVGGGPRDTDLRTAAAVEPLAILPVRDDSVEGLFGELRSRTHPPTAERIERIRTVYRRQIQD